MTTLKYYAGSWHLDKLVADPSVDIEEVVLEVERLCRCEAGASESYREQPNLLYPGHPWAAFVATGNAAYLGWEAEREPLVVHHALRNGTVACGARGPEQFSVNVMSSVTCAACIDPDFKKGQEL